MWGHGDQLYESWCSRSCLLFVLLHCLCNSEVVFSILAYEILRALVFCVTFIASVKALASQNAELECFGDVLGLRGH